MPGFLFEAYAEMRPRLEAERFLDLVDATVIARAIDPKPEQVRSALASARRRARLSTNTAPGAMRLRTAADWARLPGVRHTRVPAKAKRGGERT